ncbi:MAG: AsmA-like C-terminal region-containing protein, partial [Rickettsiales bacterium]
ITGHGASQRDIVSSLNGKGNIKVNDGEIRGVNIAQLVSNAKAMVTGADTSGDKTKFSELSGTYTIAQGIVKNDDLAMKAPLLRLKGAGTVDLPNRYVNYRLIPSVVATLKGQGGEDKTGLEIPVVVEGNFEKLKFTPDLASVAEDALKDPEKIKDTVKTIKESIKKDNVKDLLKGFR